MTSVEPVMTWRARFYLSVATARHGSLGLVALVLDYEWGGVDAGIPIPAWGAVFLLGAAHLLYSAVKGSERHARVALAVSAVITSVWAASFWLLAVGERGPTGILLAITFTALTAKDLTIVGDPMRSPFEPIIREYIEQGRG